MQRKHNAQGKWSEGQLELLNVVISSLAWQGPVSSKPGLISSNVKHVQVGWASRYDWDHPKSYVRYMSQRQPERPLFLVLPRQHRQPQPKDVKSQNHNKSFFLKVMYRIKILFHNDAKYLPTRLWLCIKHKLGKHIGKSQLRCVSMQPWIPTFKYLYTMKLYGIK